MKIKIFQAGKGDALLISDTKANILVDGGMSAAYNEHIAPELGKMRKKGITLDLACVSHIDDDHIAGFLKMIEDEVEWRVHEYHQSNGNAKSKKPEVPRPPDIKEIWHNAFHEVLKENAGEVEDMLAATANILSGSDNPLMNEEREVALGERNAIRLSRRLRPDQLNIPLNKPFKRKFVMYRKNQKPLKYGGLNITIIAPFKQDLEDLRKKWDAWLRKNKA
ncbi:MAG: MBL fold metallo-hydrolase, partial [Chitinophagaceae bacterium]